MEVAAFVAAGLREAGYTVEVGGTHTLIVRQGMTPGGRGAFVTLAPARVQVDTFLFDRAIDSDTVQDLFHTVLRLAAAAPTNRGLGHVYEQDRTG